MVLTLLLATNTLLQHSINSTKINKIEDNNDNKREVRRASQQHYLRLIFLHHPFVIFLAFLDAGSSFVAIADAADTFFSPWLPLLEHLSLAFFASALCAAIFC
jgi:hypothetical protein